MRRKILLNGPRVANDERGWYAVVSERHVEALGGKVIDCDVYHPKDSPDNPDDRAECNVLAAASTVEECIDALVEDGWLDDGTEPDVLDFPVPA